MHPRSEADVSDNLTYSQPHLYMTLSRTKLMFLLSAHPHRLLLTFICFDPFNLSNAFYRVRLVMVAEMIMIIILKPHIFVNSV